MKISVLPLAIGLVAGVVIGRGWQRDPAPPPAPEISEREREARELLQTEAQKIAAMPDTPERQAKQDELLAKVLKLFLIDVSLRLVEHGKPAAVAVAAPAPTPAPPPEPAPSHPTGTQRADAAKEAREKAKENYRRHRLYARIVEATDANQVQRELKQFASKDLSANLKASSPLPRDQALALIGFYEGFVNLDNGDRWTATMEITPVQEKPDQYNQEIKLSKNGRVFSNSHGTGRLSDFRYSEGNGMTPQIYVNIGGDYLQLMTAPEIPGFIGIHYSTNPVRELVPDGRITLRKIR